MADAGATITKPADPTVPDFEFKGWYKDFNCESAWDFDNDRVDRDIVLFPKWESIPTYSLSFDATGCDNVPEQITGIPKNSTFSTSGNILTVRNPNGTEFKRIEVTPDYDHKGYAKWAPASGEITANMVISVSFSSI